MKKVFLLFLSISLFSLASYGVVGKYKVFKKDSYIGSIEYYKLDERIYFNLNDLVKVLNGSKNIYSVSMKIVISLNSKKLIITKDSVNYDDIEKLNLPKSIITRGGKYFISSDVFINEYFAKIFEIKFDVDEKNKIISIYEDINVSAVKFFSYIEKTRVSVFMTEELKYNVELVGKVLTLTIFNASYVLSNETLNVNDGNVKDINISQDKRNLKVLIEIGENYGGYDVMVLKDPQRIVIDIKSKIEKEKNRLEISSASESGVVMDSASFTLPDKIKKKNEKKVVVIDPGHGGKDPGGKTIFGKKEKEINLEIAKRVYALFKKDDNFKVIITRDSDVFVPLYERSKIANDAKCDIFISIHANAHKNRRENGFEIYFLSEKANDPWANEVADYENASIKYEDITFDYTGAAIVLHSLARNEYINEGSKIAAYITKEMTKSTPFAPRGIKQAAFYVLRGTYCPGVLVEVGFMTNKKDKKNLDNPKVMDKVAYSIYRGVVNYDKEQK